MGTGTSRRLAQWALAAFTLVILTTVLALAVLYRGSLDHAAAMLLAIVAFGLLVVFSASGFLLGIVALGFAMRDRQSPVLALVAIIANAVPPVVAWQSGLVP